MSGKYHNLRNNMSAAQVKSRIDKLMASKLQEDEEFGEIMEYLQGLVGNTEVTERQLRLALQDRELALNREFLQNFEKINTEVQGFVDKIRHMNTICTELTSRIQTNKERTQNLLSKTSLLQNEKKQLVAQQEYIDNFFDKFSLSADEERILSTAISEVTVSDAFFKTLQRLCSIEENTRNALNAEPENAALIEIERSLKEKLEDAYKTLFHSTQRECRLLNVEFLELKPVLYQSLEALQTRTELFDAVLEEYSSARRSYVVRVFIEALTKGRGSSKPIEQLSTDPLRYCSDIAVMIHQILELETELLKSLLKSCNPEIILPTTKRTLCGISEALCQPLKLRVEQTLTRETNCVVLYRLSSLFLFYTRQFEGGMSSEAMIVKTLMSLHELASNMFFSVVSSTVQKILSNMNTPDYDLMPVHAIHQTLLLLRDILESQNDFAFTAVLDKKEMYTKIFSHVLDPLNQSIQLICSNLHNPLDVAVYMLNCLNAIKTVIIMYQYTDAKLEMIKAQIEANEDVLVSEQASSILAKTEMLQIYTKCIAHQPNQGPLSKISGMEQERIQQSLNAFNSFLDKPEGFQCHQTVKVSSSRSRETVQRRTFENVVGAYRIVHQKLADTSNLYANLELKSVEEVTAKLLSQF
ncbi:Conserved oligomeric Golgi complex subunit 6 [Aphelenchoides besseyi]|nr:Conserved oligomeric Golgi complex subunit 6 [Aphelenchoides besseyi]